MKQVTLNIHGRVQGVGFRYSSRRHAKSLGLKGYVMNMPDGTVKLVAQGDDDSIHNLIVFCRKGPLFARVDKVEIKEDKIKERFDDFNINWSW